MEDKGGNLIENLLDLDFDSPSSGPSMPTPPNAAIPAKTDQLLDLLSMDAPLPVASTPAPAMQYPVLLSAENGKGLEISGKFVKK